MKPEYSVTVLRHSGDDTTEIIDKYITADEAIDLLLHIQENVHGPQGDVPEEEVEEPEVAEKEEPEPAPKRKKSGKPADATEPIERLRKAQTRAPRGCSKCGQLGHNARTCSGPKTGDGLTEYERRKQEKEAEAPDEDPTLAEVANMAAEGLSQAELQMMFPSVPMYEIIKAWERHNHV